MTENALQVLDQNAGIMPVASSDAMLERYHTIVDIKDKIMHRDVDYGVIPGTDKPTLLKPGAEKLCTAFGLVPEFEGLDNPDLTALMNSWASDSVPFIIYRYRCTLRTRDGRYTVGSGIGSCNSWEKKYRYRKAERICPNCGEAAIIKGKAEYGGGWLCWNKKGGCGAKFNDNDPDIIGQEAGYVDNPDIAEVINTLDKMAQKRALVAATLVAVGASDFFTQDIEDLPQFNREVVEGEITEDAPAPEVNVTDFGPRPWDADTFGQVFLEYITISNNAYPNPSAKQSQYIASLMQSAFDDRKDRLAVLTWLMNRDITTTNDLTGAEASGMIDLLADEDGQLGPHQHTELHNCLREAMLAQGQADMFEPAGPDIGDGDNMPLGAK